MSAQLERDDAAADVEVAKRVEAMLKHEGLNLKGSSDTQAWAAPSDFWRDSSYRLCGINQCVGAPDNSSISPFSAMAWPSWLGRAVRNRHRHAIEQAPRRWRGEVDATHQHERAVKFGFHTVRNH